MFFFFLGGRILTTSARKKREKKRRQCLRPTRHSWTLLFPPDPSAGPMHPSPHDGQTQQDKPKTPISSITRLDGVSDVNTELSMSLSNLSGEILDNRTEEGYALLSSHAKKKEKDHNPTAVRCEVGQVDVDATSCPPPVLPGGEGG